MRNGYSSFLRLSSLNSLVKTLTERLGWPNVVLRCNLAYWPWALLGRGRSWLSSAAATARRRRRRRRGRRRTAPSWRPTCPTSATSPARAASGRSDHADACAACTGRGGGGGPVPARVYRLRASVATHDRVVPVVLFDRAARVLVGCPPTSSRASCGARGAARAAEEALEGGVPRGDARVREGSRRAVPRRLRRASPRRVPPPHRHPEGAVLHG